MDKQEAIRKLHKAIGKGFGYRLNPKAATHDEKEKVKAAMKDARAEKERLSLLMTDRERELLAGDQEYQQRRAAWKEATAHYQRLSRIAYTSRITVGHSTGMFFMVKAEGDNWEEVVDKVTKDK